MSQKSPDSKALKPGELYFLREGKSPAEKTQKKMVRLEKLTIPKKSKVSQHSTTELGEQIGEIKACLV